MKYSRRTSIGSRSTASNRLFMGSQPFRGRDVCWKTDVVTFWNLFDFHSPRHLQVWVDRLRPTVITLNTVWHLCWFVIEHSTAHWFALTNRTVFQAPHSEPTSGIRNLVPSGKWPLYFLPSELPLSFFVSLSPFLSFVYPRQRKHFAWKFLINFHAWLLFSPLPGHGLGPWQELPPQQARKWKLVLH